MLHSSRMRRRKKGSVSNMVGLIVTAEPHRLQYAVHSTHTYWKTNTIKVINARFRLLNCCVVGNVGWKSCFSMLFFKGFILTLGDTH